MTLASLVKKHRRSAGREIARPSLVYLQTSGKGAHQRARVLLELTKNPSGLTRNELARNLRVPINAVCGRLDELLHEDLVIRGAPRPSTVSGRLNETFRARQAVLGAPAPSPDHAPRQALLEGWA